MSQGTKNLRKLARQFGLLEEGTEADTVEVFVRLHEACHQDMDLVKAIARDLDDRFRSTVARVRSMHLKDIKELEMSLPLPLLWAVLRDCRAEVRSHGRHLVHGLLLDALRGAREGKGKERDLSEAVRSLEAQAAAWKREVADLKRELREKCAENERLKNQLIVRECRRESGRPEESGKGRLTREVRKLRHDLEGHRQRIKELERILADSGTLLPEKVAPAASLEAAGERKGICIFQRPRIVPADKELCAGKKSDCCRDCPLDGLRVAVVGGLSRMQPEYREIVRQLGAEPLFHDGEVRNGSYKLKSLVCGADIVVFITSVNSHGALSVVRAVCKKTGKKFMALKETGSESLEKILRNCAA
jgi:hypothetical protein